MQKKISKCCYNISDALLKLEKIERIVIREVNARELDIAEKNVDDEYINICNDIDYYQLLKRLETTNQSYIVGWDSFVSGKEIIYTHLVYQLHMEY